MKRAILAELKSSNFVLSINKGLHILAHPSSSVTKNTFMEYPLIHTHPQENLVRFVVDEDRDSLVLIDDLSKNLREYSLQGAAK
jgi:hypothetical protein